MERFEWLCVVALWEHCIIFLDTSNANTDHGCIIVGCIVDVSAGEYFVNKF